MFMTCIHYLLKNETYFLETDLPQKLVLEENLSKALFFKCIKPITN